MSNTYKSKTLTPQESYLFILLWPINLLGGVNQVVENLMHQMDLRGRYKPLLMVNSWEDKKLRKQIIKGVTHHFFRLRSPFNKKRPLKNLFVFCAGFVATMIKLYRFIKSNKVAVINIHYCGLYALNISIAKALGLFRGRFILSFHGKDLLSIKNTHGIEKRLWRLLLNSANSITTCSESLKTILISFHPRCSDKIVAIHNGIDNSYLKNKRDFSYQFEKSLLERKIILNIGTFEYKKGQDILLRAFSKIASLFPDADLVIIGRPEKALNELKKLIHDLDLEQRVWLYEGLPHDQVASFYERATIFVLPSRFEPFGIVILEAGVFGLPVIASRVGGIIEILTHGHTGRLCESENVEELSKELIYLLDHPEERIRLGNNLRHHVIEKFSWESAYFKYIQYSRSYLHS